MVAAAARGAGATAKRLSIFHERFVRPFDLARAILVRAFPHACHLNSFVLLKPL
jgi:hypothetical protein